MFMMPGSRIGRRRAPSGLVLLAQQSAISVAQLDFANFISPLYDEYEIELIGLVPATNGVNLTMRMSTDNGATFISSGSYAYHYAGWNRFGSANGGADAGTEIRLTTSVITNDTTGGVSGFMRLYDPVSKTRWKMVEGKIVTRVTGAGALETDIFSGALNSTSEVNGLRFFFSSGNIVEGTVRIYGIAK